MGNRRGRGWIKGLVSSPQSYDVGGPTRAKHDLSRSLILTEEGSPDSARARAHRHTYTHLDVVKIYSMRRRRARVLPYAPQRIMAAYYCRRRIEEILKRLLREELPPRAKQKQLLFYIFMLSRTGSEICILLPGNELRFFFYFRRTFERAYLLRAKNICGK